MIGFNPKPTRTKLELAYRDPEGVHTVEKCLSWSDNEVISHLHKILCIEGHLSR